VNNLNSPRPLIKNTENAFAQGKPRPKDNTQKYRREGAKNLKIKQYTEL